MRLWRLLTVLGIVAFYIGATRKAGSIPHCAGSLLLLTAGKPVVRRKLISCFHRVFPFGTIMGIVLLMERWKLRLLGPFMNPASWHNTMRIGRSLHAGRDPLHGSKEHIRYRCYRAEYRVVAWIRSPRRITYGPGLGVRALNLQQEPLDPPTFGFVQHIPRANPASAMWDRFPRRAR